MVRRSVFARVLTLSAPLALSAQLAFAQTPVPAPAPAPAPEQSEAAPRELRHFRIGGEVKIGLRHSGFLEWELPGDYPPSFIPPGDTGVFMRTPSAGTSFEIANVALIAEGDLTDGLAAKVQIHFLDLYNRNPTSSDDRVFVREAWLRLGRTFDKLDTIAGTSGYLLVGQAPRFSKPLSRRLESYGLWTNAVGRFENPQIQGGGTIGRHVYWRASAGIGNALFMRDVNALAGDNGTPERVPNSRVRGPYESGFPILYDAKAQDPSQNGELEYGFGGGYAASADHWAIDILGWYFGRDLAESVKLRGTYYSGDLDLLVPPLPPPFGGNDKSERGVNVDARLRRLRLFGQYVDQEIAGLPRRGVEVEAAYRIPLDGLFLVGETPVMNWLQPIVRLSHIDNRFTLPWDHAAPSFGWDWTKIDVGFRLGLTDYTDFTFEYNVNNAKVSDALTLHPNEALALFRVGF